MKRHKKKTRFQVDSAVADKLWSEYILTRDKRTCRACGRPGNNPHHIFSRRNRGIRWEPDNGICLCWACHRHKAHENSLVFAEWVKKEIGAEVYDGLLLRAQTATKTDPQMAILALTELLKEE